MYRAGSYLFYIIFFLALCFKSAFSQEDLSGVYGEVNKSVVIIKVADENREPGSGVIIGITLGGSAIILTARHVIQDYQEAAVSFSGVIENSSGKVEDYTISENYDIAFVSVPNPPKDLEVINFRESVASKGDNIGAIGHPEGYKYTWSEGSIANIFGDYIYHTAELKKGSSGGPLLDECGRMIGMNVKIRTDSAAQDTVEKGKGLALSSASIISVMNGLFSETKFEEKWEYKKYCSFWEKLYKDPFYIGGEVVGLAGIILLLTRSKPVPEPTFGLPPNPP
jgi:S1-C subfamily serine protease